MSVEVADYKAAMSAIQSGARVIHAKASIVVPTSTTEIDFRGATFLPAASHRDHTLLIPGNARIRNLVVASVKDRAGVRVTGSAMIRDVRIVDGNPGTGIAAAHGSRVSVKGLRATTFGQYAAFADGADLFEAIDWQVNGGSTGETIIRIEGGTKRAVLTGNTLDNQRGPKTCVRIHWSGEVTLANENYIAGTDMGRTCLWMGPLSVGDGGREHGICQWPDGNYTGELRDRAIALATKLIAEKRPHREISDACAALGGKSAATVTEALKIRAAKLAQRTNNVTVANCKFKNGLVGLSAGLLSGTMTDSRIDAGHFVFGQWVARYPDTLLMPLDVMRPAPKFAFERVVTTGKELGIKPRDWPGVAFGNCTFNGTAI